MDWMNSSPSFIGLHALLVNDSTSRWIKCKQGLSQGDPISPFLFILVVNVLAWLLKRADALGLIERIGSLKEYRGILSLHFANDILLLCTEKEESMLVAKAILLAFEAASRLKINFHKSSIYCLNMNDGEASKFASWLNCKKGDFLFIYLGLLLHFRKFLKQCWVTFEWKSECETCNLEKEATFMGR